MKINISSFNNLLFVLNSLKNNDNIEIIDLDSSVIPHMDFFIDCCKDLECSVLINKQLLVDHDILEHFSDRVKIH